MSEPNPAFPSSPASRESLARVTVVLSSYNHAPFLAAAIESVLAQRYSDFDLVIWDDASTDESWEIIERYRRQDARIRSFRNARNLRDAYRMALSRLPAVGEFVAIHHSDDLWDPDKLRSQVECLDARPELGAVFTGVQVIDERGNPFDDASHGYHHIFDQPNRGRHAWLRRFFVEGNCLCHPSVLIRAKTLAEVGGYRYGLAQLPDLDLWIRLCLGNHEIHILQERLTRFRVRDDEANMSGNRPDARNRLQYEIPKLMENYLRIHSLGDYEAIFGVRPQAVEHIPYLLAMFALEKVPAMRKFGLDILFAQLNSETGARALRDHFGFGHAEFIELTGRET